MKRLSLITLSLFAISGLAISANHYLKAPTNQPPKTLKMKVMRGNDQLKNKPSAAEIAWIRAAQEGEREFEDSMPKHVPLKIRIPKEKEKEFKDLTNERWARDFELEVTNTGNKPIYFLSIYLNTDVIAEKGYRIVFPLSFGRAELSDFRKKAQADDLAIQPGETRGLRIHPGQLEAWEARNRAEHRRHPKKISAIFQLMTFGDGTGYAGTDGSPLPRASDGKISYKDCPYPAGKDGPRPSDWAFDNWWHQIS